MATVILVRHGRTTANTAGVLAGRQAGVSLDATGRGQADCVAARLAAVPLASVATSPLERCRQTAAPIARAQAPPVPVVVERGLTECDYGAWQGRRLAELAKEKLWATVQQQPSAVTFPEGESMRAMQARAVDAVRRHDAAVQARHGADATWVACSHGDLVKAVLAEALGMHLDQFQRLVVDPASVSVVRYTAARPFVLMVNTHEGDLSWLKPPRRRARGSRRSGEGVVGGGAGPSGTRPAP